jgi:hypothetical protein
MKTFKEMIFWKIVLRHGLHFGILSLISIPATLFIFGPSSILGRVLSVAGLVFWGIIVIGDGMKEFRQVKEEFPQHFQSVERREETRMKNVQKSFWKKCLDKWIPIHEMVMYPPTLVFLITVILCTGLIHWKVTHGMISGFIFYGLVSILGLAVVVEVGARL